jgi:hypothetical protein
MKLHRIKRTGDLPQLSATATCAVLGQSAEMKDPSPQFLGELSTFLGRRMKERDKNICTIANQILGKEADIVRFPSLFVHPAKVLGAQRLNWKSGLHL